MSKPMLVTFPFTLFLLDIWPLRRVRWPSIFWEKLPLIALSAGASVVTYLVQGSTGTLSTIPLATRTENAFLSYLTYIGQMFWPTRLAFFYPYPAAMPGWQAAAACAVVVAMSVLAIRAWRTRPYLAVGWFWYLGTLVPVIGLVQAGAQAHADRYMYIPMVGLSVMLAWGAADVVMKWPQTKPALAAAAVVSCAACMALAWKQATYWQNSETLFQRAIEVTEDNALAEYNLGTYLVRMQRCTEAILHFETALRIQPGYDGAHINLGVCLNVRGDYAAAIPHFEAALQANPNYADAHVNLGTSLSKIPGRAPDAIKQFEAALRLSPDDWAAHASLGEFLAGLGRTEEAIPHLEVAQRIHPDATISEMLGRLRAGHR
jgi:tetratricopeptide (TPR) repeat protein